MARQPQLYLDNNATTPLRPDAVSAMQLAMGPPSNPSSVHGYGRAARMIVEEARAEIAMLAGCRGADLVFTSGGTEANNLALSMFDTIITSAVEHDSVMQAAPDAKRIPVDSEGRVDLAALGEMLASLDDAARPRTLVSVMTANNETGVIQPIDEIVALAKSAGVAVHSDMVQALGKQHLDFRRIRSRFRQPVGPQDRRSCRCRCASGAARAGDDKPASWRGAGAGPQVRHRKCDRHCRVRRGRKGRI